MIIFAKNLIMQTTIPYSGKKRTALLAAMFSALSLMISCGGRETITEEAAEAPRQETEVNTEASIADSMTNKGIGPVSQVALGALDAGMSAKGKSLFDTKCASCHKLDSKYVGPSLQGVTKRRTPEWIMNLMLNPEQMIKEDPLAKSLFEKYLVPMTFQNLTESDARSILEYFRQQDGV